MLTKRQRAVFYTALFFLPASLLGGCFSSPKENLENLLATSPQGKLATISTNSFHILAIENNKGTNHINVYIEGDGQAWIDPWTISKEPSPYNPIGYKLSAVDSRLFSTLYLARPCQFIQDSRCAPIDWTSLRFGPKIIAAYNQALDEIKSRWNVKSLTLHGYSGGATIALLIAAHRNDVIRVITFAPLLDPNAWTMFHKYSPLIGSLSPLHFPSKLRTLPQDHFIGLEDEEVPIEVAKSYFLAIPESRTNIMHKVPGFSHESDWPELWKSYILKNKI